MTKVIEVSANPMNVVVVEESIQVISIAEQGVAGLAGAAGATGATGAAGTNGHGVPVGGSAYQILRKKSGNDFDTEWAEFFRDSGVQTLTNTGIVWTGTTAPSGSTLHSYAWVRLGNMVQLEIYLEYANNGSGISAVMIPLPADCPTPRRGSGLTGANDKLAQSFAILKFSTTDSGSAGRVFLQNDAAATGYEIAIIASSGSHRIAMASLTYRVA